MGFRGDIGYQSFLYSNVTEIRRVFMFLIERLPKEVDKDHLDESLADKKSLLDHHIRQNIKIQLNAAWTPQYCKKFGARKFGNLVAIQASNNGFLPQRLYVPFTTNKNQSKELSEYWSKRSPTVFQQTSSNNICASLIQKNDEDLLDASVYAMTTLANNDSSNVVPALQRKFHKLIQIQKSIIAPISKTNKTVNMKNVTTVQQLALNNVEIPHEDDIVVMPEIRESDTIRFEIEKIKADIKNIVSHRQEIQSQLSDCQTELKSLNEQLPQLQNEKKLKERARLLLENPEENIAKMTKALATSHERIKKLQDQWDEHRIPLEQQIETARSSSNSKYVSHIITDTN